MKHYFSFSPPILLVSFRNICIVTAALPLITLTVCFITAYIFQSEEIHETHCKVYNVIPSISAITGVSPQRYFWRICIALHIGPRIAIAAVYRNHYRSSSVQSPERKAKPLINVVFGLQLIEIGSLCGVTYVSNRENYPVHERLFITFMVCSLCHMLASIKLMGLIRQHKEMTEAEEFSFKCKKLLFGLSIASTIGLILFFLKHRFLCHDMAFSWFAFCEYIIASANMGFHCTTMLDFPTEDFVIAHRIVQSPSSSVETTNESRQATNSHMAAGDCSSILPLSCKLSDQKQPLNQYKKEK